uniref:EngB-type G domain-containing protein n=1 Tax=Coccolithus braarudii TaxID=221442 RepID=A0A7S0LL08_9EUKA
MPVIARSAATMSWQKEAEAQGVEFLGSFTEPRGMPNLRLPEITLAGRSNVGKSSALNALSGRRKKAAKVSKTPGRTRLINLFKVGKACAITDLPGYGFAKVSREMQDDWRRSIEAYFRNREQLRLAVLFVDAQREPQESDGQLLEFLLYNELPTVVVATKADKLSQTRLKASLRQLSEEFDLPEGQPIPFSSQTGAGVRELWQYLQQETMSAS